MAGDESRGPRRPKPPARPATAPASTRTPTLVPADYDDDETTGPIDIAPIQQRRSQPQVATPAIVVVIKPASAHPGHRYVLLRTEYQVGRKLESDIALDVPSVSRRHARLYRKDDVWWVEDLRSTNGTFLNDDHVTDGRPLKDGDQVRFGEAVLRFLAGTNPEVQYHEEIYRLAILDGLTGAHNKRFFAEVLDREIAHASRSNGAISLVLFDLDRFKLINDTHGHPAGDAVLQQLCRRIKARMRKDDMLARVGGEEFAFLLVDTGRAGALAFAEQMRELIAREPFTYETKQISATISVGVASLEAGAVSRDTDGIADSLMQRADARLYEAKNAGRNCVRG